MSQKLPVYDFKWKNKRSRLTQQFTQNYNDDCKKGYILEVQKIHSDFLFLPEIMKVADARNVSVICISCK